ncbi:vanadium-dependent haloperoxidase [Lacibacter sp. H407]|uniref:vanadium-dependent haloperoxidase n=1 Tax=Lacibacter sp. H407 TaxID=3133423 RepID=UPI0030C45E89
MKKINVSVFAACLFAMALVESCSKPDVTDKESAALLGKFDDPGFASNDMVMYWNEKAATVLTGPNTPPAQSRYFAMIQIAVHDALNSIKPKYERHALLNVREQFASPDAAVASAAYHVITKLNLQRTFPVLAWYNESLATIADGNQKELGKQVGEAAADAIILKRSTDNFAIANQQLPAPDGVLPGEYRSTLPFANVGMPKVKGLQQWGTKMTTFVLENSAQFRPVAPDPVQSDAYESDYNEVKSKGGLMNHTRTANETEVGVFWVERSTIGWNRYARNIIASKKMDAWKTARLFALLHTAMTDGVTACFEAKYYYFYWRPETAIRLGNDDGNPSTAGDATWLPSYIESPNLANPAANVYTPPIAEYPSAHANFGGAAAAVLMRFFGTSNISVSQTSGTLPGVTRTYKSILVAARDNSLSRIYVGFHFRKAALEGEAQGINVGNYVYDHSFRSIE